MNAFPRSDHEVNLGAREGVAHGANRTEGHEQVADALEAERRMRCTLPGMRRRPS